MAVKKVKKAADVFAAVKVAEPKKPAVKAKKTTVDAPGEQKSYVVIDHPLEGEIISGLHYAIRIGASDNGAVEISFDGGEWQPCRASAGYWWFDWGYFTPGTHKIVVRLRNPEGGTIKKAPAVVCEVK